MARCATTEGRQRMRWVVLFSLAAATWVMAGSFSMAAEESMHKEIDKYEGSDTCLNCHEATAREVAETVHYQFRGKDGTGMLNGFCGYANTSADHNWLGLVQPKDPVKPLQPVGCARCHAGFGDKPKAADKMTAAELKNVDCFICHIPGYQRTVVQQEVKGKKEARLAPAPGVDMLKAVQGARKPTPEMCQRCHGAAGGGPNYQDGVVPTADSDVHTSMGMSCTECHSTKKHRIAGGGDLRAKESTAEKVLCDNCHGAAPHKGEVGSTLNRHCDRVACQACHIPAIATDPQQPTLVERDWSMPQLNATTGLYVPSDKLGGNLKVDYYWWDGSFKANGEPGGARRDGKSKIYPWKRVSIRLIGDAASDTPLPIKTAVYAQTGDVAAAAKAGADEAKKSYSGKWKPLEVSAWYVLNHQVAPKDKALKCENCHDPKGVMPDIMAQRGRKPRREEPSGPTP